MEGVDLSSWRAVINCSEPVRWESHRAFYEFFKKDGLKWEALQTSYAMTENVFRDGWYLTGDYGFVSDGELSVSGRKKDMIIVGGKNVYPQDLEALTYEVPGVHAGRSVAFGLFDETQGTEEVVIIAEVDSEDEEQHQKIADA